MTSRADKPRTPTAKSSKISWVTEWLDLNHSVAMLTGTCIPWLVLSITPLIQEATLTKIAHGLLHEGEVRSNSTGIVWR
jgi:hypothetical protein